MCNCVYKCKKKNTTKSDMNLVEAIELHKKAIELHKD
jgi:hypothetical protein